MSFSRSPFIFISCFLILSASQVMAERYRIVDLADGGVKAVKVVEAAEAVESSAQYEEVSEQVVPESSEDLRQVRSKVVPEPVQSQTSNPLLVRPETELNDSELSVFEKRYLESERAEQKAALEKILNADEAAQVPQDLTSIDDSEFVDGDQLLIEEEQGQVKPRYFVYLDAEGQRRVQYIQPELDREAMRVHAESLMPEVSEATVIMNRAVTEEETDKFEFPEGADPLAVAILSRSQDEQTFFTEFAENCCTDLPEVRRWDISQDRSYLLQIKEDDARYRFTEGVSRFLVLELPKFKDDYRLLLRSFIKKYGEDSLERGVFFPQVITLNENSIPVRVFTGPVLKYVPETWYKHGYLEGVFEINNELEERFVLINTTPELVRQVSTIEDDELGSFELEHLDVGTFEVQALLPYQY